jgi:predicted metal-binding protein
MKIGIIICDRYRTCGAGKCFRAMRERAGAFAHYPADEGLELVGFSTCAGCPGGNIEYVPEEMIRNGAEAIHLATGMIVGYPPCPYLDDFRAFVERRFGIPVVAGTHPVPEKYCAVHRDLASWSTVRAYPALLATEGIRRSYD